MDCLFCKIIKKETPSDIVYEDEEILGLENIQPEAPVHLLFIPKRHVEWKGEFDQKDLQLLARLISVAKKIAVQQKIDEAYKLIFNVGKTGHITHIHLHLLGGWKDKIPMHNI
ncbi:HIT domain-containing protein [Patescibacteria group bacterium]|nr:HIT domain-containing protein [Patescibacteria group bacterium]